jgi:hypothetical protein
MLNPNEQITSITSILSDQAGLIMNGFSINTLPVIYPDKTVAPIGKVISVRIADGIIPAPQLNQLYTIRAVFTTNDNNIREATVFLNVTNIPRQSGRIV